ncbi:DNA-binding transcriptional repressor YiaJ [Castellaniella defragrans]
MKSNREENPPVADGDERVAGVAAVNRALSILEAFTVESPTLSLVELSEKTGLYKSTILRLIESLESFGYIQRSSAGSYVVGAAPLRLAAVARNDLHPAEKIMPALRALAERTRESASFYVRSGDKRLCAYRVDSPRSIRDHVQPGQLLPLNVGAAGHVLQIFADPARDPDLFRRRTTSRRTSGEPRYRGFATPFPPGGSAAR